MVIHSNFPGVNIHFVEENGTDIFLKNEIRDSGQDWFYWAFCVENAGGSTCRCSNTNCCW